jgi:outer membrane protein assembly factor BamB
MILCSSGPAASQTLPSVQRWNTALAAAPLSPAIAAGPLIVVPLRTGSIVAVRQKDGGPVWTSELGAEQPIVADDTHVYVVSGEALRALRIADGAIAWVAKAGTVTAPPFVRDGWVLLASGSTLTAFRAADGSRIWEKVVGPMAHSCDVDGDVAFVPLADANVVALDLKTGDVRWKRPLGGAPGEPLAVGGRVYFGAEDKYFYSLRASNGDVDYQPRVGAMTRGRPAVDDDHVYVAGMDNVVRAFDRGHGGLQWKRGMPFRPAGGPVLVESGVVVPGRLVPTVGLLDPRTGTPAGAIEFGAPLGTTPLFLKDERGGLLVAAVTTTRLENKWALVLFEPGAPSIPVVPLSELPGQLLPIPSLER